MQVPDTENEATDPIWTHGAQARRAAAGVCISAARRVGLPTSDVRWLRLGERAVLSLDSGRIIVRIERPDVPVGDVAYEIAIATWLATNGVSVSAPLEVDQPVKICGLLVTFWGGTTGTPVAMAELGRALRAMHDLVPPAKLARPARPFDRLQRRIDRATSLTATDRVTLGEAVRESRARWAELVPRTTTPGFLHGDATPDNVLTGTNGPVVVDLEYSGWGPREWDLTHLASRYDDGLITTDQYTEFCRTYGQDVRTAQCYAVLRQVRRLRELTGMLQNPGPAGSATVTDVMCAIAGLHAEPAPDTPSTRRPGGRW